MLSLSYYVRTPRLLLAKLVVRTGYLLSDKWYLIILFYLRTGKKLHLKNPQSFGEKIQWLKLYNRQPKFTIMVDKLEVKEYVSKIIGKEYVIPLLGVWDRPEDITFDTLPRQFVLKTTHGGGFGGVIVCKDKEVADRKDIIRKLNSSLKQDLYKSLREWPYKNVPRKIMAEQYIEDTNSIEEDMIDYKFYCFDGKPIYCQVIKDRHSKETIDFYDMDWIRQEFMGLNPLAVHSNHCLHKPIFFEKMKEIAQQLSKDLPFARIDIYETQERPYFGEITLYPASGLGRFVPERYNQLLGDMINLPLT